MKTKAQQIRNPLRRLRTNDYRNHKHIHPVTIFFSPKVGNLFNENSEKVASLKRKIKKQKMRIYYDLEEQKL